MSNYTTRRKVRTPLTASQHILHLLLTLLTFGLWGIVWLIRAAAGNVTWAEVQGDTSAGPILAPPIPGSWADRALRGQERQPRR